ncbi:hypothetical protein HERIO_2600 [Hepatospora eriocheir]|uniref:Uncharacterized protein n=1 Tax=Hepatospora eriocheir TaxID=1081669 RepID=A0A1X0Q688_9MICR|nr:hypothetical protein HERIO_2600 [Hepatospora eriocheir]
MKKHASKLLEKTLKDLEKFVHEQKPIRDKNNFKNKQLQFLKGNVNKAKIPFKRILLKIDRKKKRRAENIEKKHNMGIYK